MDFLDQSSNLFTGSIFFQKKSPDLREEKRWIIEIDKKINDHLNRLLRTIEQLIIK